MIPAQGAINFGRFGEWTTLIMYRHVKANLFFELTKKEQHIVFDRLCGNTLFVNVERLTNGVANKQNKKNTERERERAKTSILIAFHLFCICLFVHNFCILVYELCTNDKSANNMPND